MAIYHALANFSMPEARIIFPKSPTHFRPKYFILLEKSFLGNFYRHLATFTGHTDSQPNIQRYRLHHSCPKEEATTSMFATSSPWRIATAAGKTFANALTCSRSTSATSLRSSSSTRASLSTSAIRFTFTAPTSTSWRWRGTPSTPATPVPWHLKVTMNCGQSYKQFTIVIYNSRVVIWSNFKSGVTLES